jgi:glycerol-3-phosphate acyltransferase PlsY
VSHDTLLLVLVTAAAFLIGSFPTGVLVARAKGIDLRQVGSGNVGATNVGRALGKKWALFVLLADAAKGAVPVLVVRAVLPGAWPPALVALGAVFGHVFSIFLRFRGGKGVATALGGALALAPLAGVSAFGVWLALYLPLRLSSLGSLVGAVSYTAFLFAYGQGHSANVTYGATATLLIIARHHENIRRLIKGRELKA